MNITICGGGNLGHACAAYLSSSIGNRVCMLTRSPQKWSGSLECRMPDGSTRIGTLFEVTNDPQIALVGAEMVLLCLPGYAIKGELERIKPFLSPDTAVGSIVCSTGFFQQAHYVLPWSQPLFGFQRTPFISRVIQYGESVDIKGTKKMLYAALRHLDPSFCDTLALLFGSPVTLLDNIYEAILSNSNPLLHTSRLYSMWRDWNGEVYPTKVMFYEGWTVQASEIYIAMDTELQALLLKLEVPEGAIATVLDYYDSYDAASLTRKLSGIEAFKGIEAPMKEVAGGFVPDFENRYFTEDFPYGLKFIWEIAHYNGVPCPVIDEVYAWGAEKLHSAGKID